MKKLLLLSIMGLGVLGLQAQDSTQLKGADKPTGVREQKLRRPARTSAHAGMNRMDSVLQLTEAQKIKLKELDEEYRQKRLAVYTPEQKARLEQFQQSRKQRMKQGRHAKSPLVSNLTEEQKLRMQTLRKQQREEASLIKANTALSEAEKKTKLKALQEANRENMRKILTPEQQEQLNKRLKTHMDGPAR
ncbi:hypothetical protein [Flavihumibacter sp. CACIAM 22H1]|uniref:hypothetical protein n=1 Tax=Flavihumibacter sp. CACIAM 22H1 TaxID=1812911 RepID=UPI000AC94105|nr:hypothetical protein [Flavihumibacter sp. CACIAM 22H1]